MIIYPFAHVALIESVEQSEPGLLDSLLVFGGHKLRQSDKENAPCSARHQRPLLFILQHISFQSQTPHRISFHLNLLLIETLYESMLIFMFS